MSTKQFRVCSSENCKARLPDLSYDGHSKCSNCIGKLCAVDDHCDECVAWPSETFNIYLKHRHTLELTRLRKAKQRAKAKQASNVGDGQQAVTGHSLSPSPSTSVVSLSTSPISPYSPTTITKSISMTPTAVTQAPSDQVVSRAEFDSLKELIMTMATDLASVVADKRSGQGNSINVHSESVPQPSLAVPSTSGIDSRLTSLGREPPVDRTILSLVEGFTTPEGESCLPEACPMVQQETLERSRKRSRELDSATRAKRQRAPSRERVPGSTTAVAHVSSAASPSPAHASPAVKPSQSHAPSSLVTLPSSLARSTTPYPSRLAVRPRLMDRFRIQWYCP